MYLEDDNFLIEAENLQIMKLKQQPSSSLSGESISLRAFDFGEEDFHVVENRHDESKLVVSTTSNNNHHSSEEEEGDDKSFGGNDELVNETLSPTSPST